MSIIKMLRASSFFAENSISAELRARNAAIVSGGILLAIYSLTLAPDVTWWDSGEFIAAAHSLGIPHPPGVPLYVLLAHISSKLFWWLGAAASVNFLSALSVAGAGAIGASIVTRYTESVLCGVVAAVCAGVMSTVWLNATEAEVYATALLLAALMLWSAFKAGESNDARWLALTAYFLALAAPLHLTALIAAPAAIVAASWRISDAPAVDLRRVLLLGGATLLSFGVGKANLPLAITGVLLLVIHFLTAQSEEQSLKPAWTRVPIALTTLLVVALGVSAVLFMLFRAAHDPGVNQGNPETIDALRSVLAREQYQVAPLLPRQTAFWLQIGNYVQYLDWQFALGIAPTSLPSVPRSLVALVFLALATFGVVQVGFLSRRLQATILTLIACSSIGVVAYLNLKAGPTIGYGILPDNAPHEVRERDYFFLISFWSIGLMAGAGAVGFAMRFGRLARPLSLLAVAIPLTLNFAATNRRSEPDALLTVRFARALLAPLPRDAVLVVAGDNDTYPLWYLQNAYQLRGDVTVVTIPLVGADWYRRELRRRHALINDDMPWVSLSKSLGDIAENAVAQGRPLAVSVSVPAEDRLLIAPTWTLRGFHYLLDSTPPADMLPRVDSAAIAQAATFSQEGVAGRVRPAIDPIARQMGRFLDCPHNTLAWLRKASGAELLDSTCNFR